MAHELIIRNGTASMAFVGETPWHGLGQRLTEGASIETWATEARMDWQALSAPVQFTRADGMVARMGEKQVIYRSDTGAPLSVMSDGYKIVQPLECLEFFRDLIAGHGFKLHTAGVLNGGRKMWALAKNGHGGEIVKGDAVRQFLMLSTSLDGTSPTTAAFTQVRIVCANTLRMARADIAGADGVVKVKHRSEFDAAAMRAELGYADNAWRVFSEAARGMAETPISTDEAREILRGIFGQPKVKPAAPAAAPAISAPVAAAQSFAKLMERPLAAMIEEVSTEGRDTLAGIIAAKEQKSVARVLELFAGAGRGADHQGVKGTRWGLLNAVTEHIDHEQGRTADTRLNSAWFGRGDDFKQQAFKALTVA